MHAASCWSFCFYFVASIFECQWRALAAQPGTDGAASAPAPSPIAAIHFTMRACRPPPPARCSTAAGGCCSRRAPAPPPPSSAPLQRWTSSQVCGSPGAGAGMLVLPCLHSSRASLESEMCGKAVWHGCWPAELLLVLPACLPACQWRQAGRVQQAEMCRQRSQIASLPACISLPPHRWRRRPTPTAARCPASRPAPARACPLGSWASRPPSPPRAPTCGSTSNSTSEYWIRLPRCPLVACVLCSALHVLCCLLLCLAAATPLKHARHIARVPPLLLLLPQGCLHV